MSELTRFRAEEVKVFIEAGKMEGAVIAARLKRLDLCLVAMEMCIVDAR